MPYKVQWLNPLKQSEVWYMDLFLSDPDGELPPRCLTVKFRQENQPDEIQLRKEAGIRASALLNAEKQEQKNQEIAELEEKLSKIQFVQSIATEKGNQTLINQLNPIIDEVTTAISKKQQKPIKEDLIEDLIIENPVNPGEGIR